MENLIYKETQKFKQWWLWLILIGANIPFLYGIYQQILMGKPFGDKPSSNIGLILSTCIPLVIFILFKIIKLQTQINNKGIYVRFFPLQLKYQFIDWDSVESVTIEKYSPILDYGGWGIRWGSKGKAYNIAGNMGLQLVFKNQKRLLIGTQSKKILEDALKTINKLNT